MNVTLTHKSQKLIHHKVATGMYQSASEVIREALRLLHEQDQHCRLQHEELRKDIEEGMKDVDAGHVAPLRMSSIKAKGRKILAQRRKIAA